MPEVPLGAPLRRAELALRTMRILLIHNEAAYFGGAEQMFLYFVSALAGTESEFVVAAVPGSRVAKSLPPGVKVVQVSDNAGLSFFKLIGQARTLMQHRRVFSFDLVHGWAARDWELAGVVGRLARCPVLGTLHDHPRSEDISAKRRGLMRLSARWGLTRLACVSSAVQEACCCAGYPAAKLAVVRNGIPRGGGPPTRADSKVVRMGYLGILSEPKGLGVMLDMLNRLAELSEAEWEFHIAGGAQQPRASTFLETLRSRYRETTWWPRVHWHGWVSDPVEFAASLDLLVFPSIMFDSFPNVLLEAALAGTPAIASKVGGVPEIIRDGETGWLVEASRPDHAAKLLAGLIARPDELRKAGMLARRTVLARFTIENMLGDYRNLYSDLMRPAGNPAN